jgi:multidrug efflux pump subunit AcrB
MQATKAKVNFVKRRGNAGRLGKMHPKIAQHFDDDDLEEEYGGTRSSDYDHDHYMQLETEYWEQQQAMSRENYRSNTGEEVLRELKDLQPQPKSLHGSPFDLDRYFEGVSNTIEKSFC